MSPPYDFAPGPPFSRSITGIGLRKGCVLSPLLFIIYMNWMDKLSRTDECVTIGRCKISRLVFADDLVLPPTRNLAYNTH